MKLGFEDSCVQGFGDSDCDDEGMDEGLADGVAVRQPGYGDAEKNPPLA
jgi:hypothetical protein